MKYEAVERLGRDEIESAIERGEPDELLRVALSAALHSGDSLYAEEVCVRLAKHSHFNVRGNAVLGFGHIARIHGRLDEATVRPLVEAALRDADDYVRGQAVAAADDVEFFLKWKIDRPRR